MRVRGTVLGVGLSLALIGGTLGTAGAEERSLYERLGRYDGIAMVVDDFLTRAL